MIRRLAPLAALAAVGALVLTACSESSTEGAPRQETPLLVLDRVQQIDPGPGFADVYTGCIPGTSVRVLLGGEGYYSGLEVNSIYDATCGVPA